ncbi:MULTISPECIES: MFS transporter [unclassified Luteococcus]|uniref:MFS transporter n=1 Tax=unclassified Luteococcus TaxID=2639923 RepID=UPI00313E0191
MSTTPATPPAQGFRGNEKLLWGIVLGVTTFWLFAGTTGTVARNMLAEINGPTTAPGQWANPHVSVNQMNLAVSITALFSGLFIVLMGGLADKLGRVKVAITGNVLGLVGSLLVVLASGSLALPLLLTGRAIQGLSAACIMPSTMALLKAYWDGPARQRAVSMWSIGSWGGSGLAAIFGGFVATNLGWRYIFWASIVISLISIAMMWGTPESRAEKTVRRRFDIVGLGVFIVTILALMIVVIFGKQLGWASITTLGLAAVALVGLTAFIWWEQKQANPFMDFSLFSNKTFTGATISNFTINATIGLLIVSQQMLQLARPERFDAWHAGLLTLGYAITIIGFIRVGEKLLQKFGPRKPMLWGAAIVGVVCVLLAMTQVLVGTYTILAVVAYALFGLGLAFYATPSTDAALSNLPAAQSGSGSGIYKMASSLGSAIGAALSLAIFTAVMGADVTRIGDAVHMNGIQTNVNIRTAGMVTMLFNLFLVVVSMISIMVTVPKQQKS